MKQEREGRGVAFEEKEWGDVDADEGGMRWWGMRKRRGGVGGS